MPELISDDGAEEWSLLTVVPNGNGPLVGLLPLEHVQLAIVASRIPQDEPIPDDILANLHWLFNIPAVQSMDLETRGADVENHCEMLDKFRSEVVA